MNYRILYFFCGQQVAVLAHSLTKEAAIPKLDIERALERKALVMKAPHTYLHVD